MFDFFNCGRSQSIGKKMNHKLIDWEQDSQIICSAINKVANKEVRAEPYIHWWTFMGYYSAVGESLLSTIVSIRDKIVRGKKLEKHERIFRQENPEYFIWNISSSVIGFTTGIGTDHLPAFSFRFCFIVFDKILLLFVSSRSNKYVGIALSGIFDLTSPSFAS